MTYAAGPWSVGPRNKSGHLPIETEDATGASGICEVNALWDEAGDNAALIAAAPDLYEAAEQAQIVLERLCALDRGVNYLATAEGDDRQKTIGRLSRALKKAKGIG